MTDDDILLACQIFAGIIYIMKKYENISRDDASKLMEKLNQIADYNNQPIQVVVDEK